MMWNHSKSLSLTSIWVNGVLAVWIIFSVTAPWLVKGIMVYFHLPATNWLPTVIIIYLIYLPVLVILYQLNRLLRHLQHGEVFIADNIKCLRVVSWACFFAAVILLLAALYQWWFMILSGIIGFFGLLMRVVKNILAEAVAIKHENDYTI